LYASFFAAARAHLDLHPFPTRRSSDLVGITYVVLIGIVLTLAEIVVMKFAPDSTDAILEFLKSSKLLSAANDTNVIGSLFADLLDRKSTRLNSSHVSISYAVSCLKRIK